MGAFAPGVAGAATPRRASAIRGSLLIPGLAALLAFAGIALASRGSGPLPGDVAVERLVQSLPWGPATAVFGLITAFNGTTQLAAGLVLLALVVAINPRAFLFSILASLSGPLYSLTNSLVDRPRPSAALVQVTEHLGGHSFPSGHAIFVLTYATLLVLCVGGKYLAGPRLIVAAAMGAAAVVFMSVARLATGGHWPTDVYGGLLLAGGWMLVLLSVGPIGRPVLAWLGDPAGAWNARYPGLPNTLASRRRLVERALYTPAVQALERLGYVVRGALWAFVGAALITSAFRLGGGVDLYGAVRIMVSTPMRGVVGAVIVLAIGGYATWGYVRTIFDPLRRGSDVDGLVARLGFLTSAGSYTLVLVFTVEQALVGAASGRTNPWDLTAWVDALAGYGGVYILGLIVFAIGVGQAIDGWREPFTHDVLLEDAPHGTLFHLWTWLGRVGLWARAALFGFLGALIMVEHASGLAWSASFTHAFARMAQLPGGPLLVTLLGLGLIALGLHSIGAARWMRLRAPVIEARR
jgi:membrane-associated phospholipid phosphatase